MTPIVKQKIHAAEAAFASRAGGAVRPGFAARAAAKIRAEIEKGRTQVDSNAMGAELKRETADAR